MLHKRYDWSPIIKDYSNEEFKRLIIILLPFRSECWMRLGEQLTEGLQTFSEKNRLEQKIICL